MKIAYFLLLLPILCFSQKKTSDVHVDYKMFCDTDVPLTFYTSLWISNNASVYQERLSTTQRWEERPSNQVDTDVTPSKDVIELYLKIDRTKKEMLFFDNIMRNTFLVKDNYADLNWKITQESKTIAGYNCLKATTNYRGREWTAWFTPEIPLSFGPWKLHGLPGLILEAQDATKRYTITAVKIENSKDNIVSRDFASLIATKNKQPISLQQFLKDRDEASDNLDREIERRINGTVNTVKAPRNGEELVYEWEK